ncbi:MAG: HlyD family type I secretion periplasmic adaptor subunit [Maricaulaceae bacterium]|jgi:HlyD family secretion protein/adhesin transport system membrane fusion protein
MTGRSASRTPTAKERQLRHLGQSARLEESFSSRIVRMTMTVVSLAVLAFIGWASLTNLYEIARAPGEVVPDGYQQVVQHLEGGIVREIDVHEGELVEQGQVLVRLDDAGVSEELEQALARQTSLLLQAERLRAFIEGRAPDFDAYAAEWPMLVRDQNASFESMVRARREERLVIADQLEQKHAGLTMMESELSTAEESLRIARDLHSRRQSLSERGHVAEVQLLETAQQVNQLQGDVDQLRARRDLALGEVDEFESRLRSLDARHANSAYEALDTVEANLAQIRETVERLRERVARLDVRAPVRGLVKGLAVNTVGGVVGAGEVLMEIVPLDRPLVVELKIPPRHIGHIEHGQQVRMNFSNFDASRYGATIGQLDFVSATTFRGPSGERYYQGRVVLPNNYIGDDPHNQIVPGMTGAAHIVTGEKSVIDYLLQPIRTSMRTAFTER